jgi:hypothetical protein
LNKLDSTVNIVLLYRKTPHSYSATCVYDCKEALDRRSVVRCVCGSEDEVDVVIAGIVGMVGSASTRCIEQVRQCPPPPTPLHMSSLMQTEHIGERETGMPHMSGGVRCSLRDAAGTGLFTRPTCRAL